MTPQKQRQRNQGLGCLALIVIVLAIWFNPFGHSTPAIAEPTAWPKSAGQTTCGEWTGSMSIAQRRGLGEAVLVALWNADGAASAPSDAQVTTFANGIGQVCASSPTDSVAAVGSGLYSLSSDIKPK